MNLGLPCPRRSARVREAMAILAHSSPSPNATRSGCRAGRPARRLASLLAMRPGHLVLDEPTAQLDPEGTRLVGEALRALAATGTALLIAEHKTDLLDGLCNRVWS